MITTIDEFGRKITTAMMHDGTMKVLSVEPTKKATAKVVRPNEVHVSVTHDGRYKTGCTIYLLGRDAYGRRRYEHKWDGHGNVYSGYPCGISAPNLGECLQLAEHML